MKTIILKSAFFIALTAGVLTSCVKDDNYSTPELNCTETTLVKNREVSQINAAAIVAQHVDIVPGVDDVIEAYITSSDIAGNFFKSISMQTLDGSKAFSVPVDATSTFISYEPGRKVLINVNDLYTDISNGGLRIGGLFVSTSTGVGQVGRLPLSQFTTSVQRSCTVVNEDDLVKHLTIAQAKSDAYINVLVELDLVQFSDAAIATTYYNSSLDLGGATNHLLVDENGDTVIFRTSSFANFAAKPVASGRGKVRGVMTKFGTDYQFVARTESDVKLTGPRLMPIFSQNFESIATTGNGANVALTGWSNVSMLGGAEKWEARIFSGNKYAQFSPFGVTPSEPSCDTRLITPAINLDATTDEFLRFGSKIGFANGVAVTVWISTNYDGTGTAAAVNAATWTQLNPIMAAQTASFPTNFTGSGNVDLSSYTGNAYISFKYVGGTTGITSTYQIDNIEVYGN